MTNDERSPILGLVTCLLLAAGVAAQQSITLVAAPGVHVIAPGQFVGAWMYDGQLPGPTLRVTAGDTVRITVVNHLPESTSLHLHGLTNRNGMDGVPGVTRPPILPGQEFTYEILFDQPGTYFYHSHSQHQLERGLHGMVIVDPTDGGDMPYDEEITIDLDDWRNTPPVDGPNPVYDAYLINGSSSAGQVPHLVQPGDVVRVRFLNSSSWTNYRVAIDGHPMTVTHSDGRRVQPFVVDALRIGAGERYDVYITANNPGTWSIAAAPLLGSTNTLVRAVLGYAGTPLAIPPAAFSPPAFTTGTLLSYLMLAAAEPSPPLVAVPDRSFNLPLTWDFSTNTWLMGGAPSSDLDVEYGEHLQLTMTNQSPHPHPMHLHGHHMRLHGTAGGTANPPLKDTVIVDLPGLGDFPSATVDVVANNPGRWAYHCHNIYHAHLGMIRFLRYTNGDFDGDGLDDSIDLDATIPLPVLTNDDLGGGFVPGSNVRFDVHWPAGTLSAVYLGLELAAPLDFGPAGVVEIHSPLLVGTTVAGVDDVASLVGGIPPLPFLSGLRFAFQALSTAPLLAPNVRASTKTVIRVN